MFRLPPREKVHEALSAVADNRVVINGNTADVSSSDNAKKYLVEWNDNIYSSNDNATYWQGYPGYPIIAVLLIQNKIKYDGNILEYFKNINWKALNTKLKNNYAKAVESIYEELKSKGIDVDYIDKEVSNIYMSLSQMDLIITKGSRVPTK